MSNIYYEEGTGSYGDASNLLFVPEPPNDIASYYENEEEIWEYVNRTHTVSLSDIIETLVQVRDRKGDYLAAVDLILDRLDFEDKERV